VTFSRDIRRRSGAAVWSSCASVNTAAFIETDHANVERSRSAACVFARRLQRVVGCPTPPCANLTADMHGPHLLRRSPRGASRPSTR
jgi:hypothetical protein